VVTSLAVAAGQGRDADVAPHTLRSAARWSRHGCKIAPRTYYAWAARPLSKRALSDIALTDVLAGYYEPDERGRRRPESLYGSLKMWAHLNRAGIKVAKCTVER